MPQAPRSADALRLFSRGARDAMMGAMEYAPVRTVRALWRLDMDDYSEGYQTACECEGIVNPNRCSRSYYLGWVSGAHDSGRIAPDADVAAIHADMALNLGSSEWVH